jgi:hypothetical protein
MVSFNGETVMGTRKSNRTCSLGTSFLQELPLPPIRINSSKTNAIGDNLFMGYLMQKTKTITRKVSLVLTNKIEILL